jgi:plasmid stabilization system protein ParE
MKVVIREKAADDIDGIFAWIAKDDPTATTELVHRVRARIQRLETPGFSHMGRIGAVANTRELVEPPYILVYQVDEQKVEITIIAIFHVRQGRG